MTGKTATSVTEYMNARTERTDSCWLWTGNKTWNGYGYYCFQKQRKRAHRVAFELANGPIAKGLVIDHMCRNRLCVNPAHLQAVTSLANNENRPVEGTGATGVRGVSWHKATSTYEAYATHGNKKFSAGRYSTLNAAATAARDLRLKLHANNLVDRGAGGNA